MDARAAVEELLRRAARREADALCRLVELYGPRVYGMLYRLTGSRDTADDLLQETFVRVTQSIGEYQHDGRFEAWLFRIAANLVRDRSRKVRRRGPTASLETDSGEAGGLEPRASDELSPARGIEGREEQEKLAACLAKLSPPEQEIIVLRHYSGLSFREIGELLGIPVGTALARAHRALIRLRAEFEA